MSFQVGQTVGDYQVEGVLGRGGMGALYKVRNRISHRVDAMKVLLPSVRSSSTEITGRFEREIQVHASLRHPNIAELYTAFQLDDQLLMVMELVEGPTLESLLAHAPLPVELSIGIIAQVLSALGYAHRQGVIHRDVKPTNIVLTRGGAVKLIDFGIALAEFNPRMTQTGMVLGSLAYMAPEQLTGQQSDARSDLYSVGITLYQALTGKRAIDGANEYDMMNAHVHQVLVPPAQLNPAIGEELSATILKSLAKQPAQRFQTADEFRQALSPYLPTSSSAWPQLAVSHLETGVQERVATMLPVEKIPSSSRFHSAALAVLHRNLAQYVGPIAKHLVLKESREAPDLDVLCRAVSMHIANESDRAAFLNACRTEFGAETRTVEAARPAQTPATPTPVPTASWDTAWLDRLKKDLAVQIGPMARVIVDRAAKKARSPQDLLSALAAEISSPEERSRFQARHRAD
ncbi:serine/threonine-protein kinase [uncultured Paludibaculum sp.]|uniref:serine/threonine-protein kinase n=1 Tax=uncultured Paludibaculum sp. TaxID=1765020 RepID=UPI002AAB2004|nr:serine/threonine-protein kinase [uncultured Paludibaculum sp.]